MDDIKTKYAKTCLDRASKAMSAATMSLYNVSSNYIENIHKICLVIEELQSAITELSS